MKKGVTETPRPCEYFDLIGGTSTGGLIAIMLGLLRMVLSLSHFVNFTSRWSSVSRRNYNELAQDVFQTDQVLQGVIPVGDDECRFDSTKLETAIKNIIHSSLGTRYFHARREHYQWITHRSDCTMLLQHGQMDPQSSFVLTAAMVSRRTSCKISRTNLFQTSQARRSRDWHK